MSSSVVGPSSSPFASMVRMLFGSRKTTTTPMEHDLESQIATEGSLDSLPEDPFARIPTPPPARVHHTRASRTPAIANERRGSTDPIDDFFGVIHSRVRAGTQDSRHDELLDQIHFDDAPPPPYAASSVAPPAYSRFEEHATLAMYLFKFGFLFPLFWIAGSFILLSPLREPEDWETTKTEDERRELLNSMRQTEVKWAKRCLVALGLLTVMVLGIVVGVLLVLKKL